MISKEFHASRRELGFDLETAIAHTRPGQPKDELQEISKAVMAEELIKLGMIEKPEEIMKYYFHSSGHYIGLIPKTVEDIEKFMQERRK